MLAPFLPGLASEVHIHTSDGGGGPDTKAAATRSLARSAAHPTFPLGSGQAGRRLSLARNFLRLKLVKRLMFACWKLGAEKEV